jgi:hypothetical protein
MADPPRYPDTDDAGGVRPTEAPPRAPRWVKLAGIIVIVLVLLFVVLKLTGVDSMGGHNSGPNRHLGGAGGGTTSASVRQR